MNEYYSDEWTTIYHAKAEDVLPYLPDDSAHLLAIDPPYYRVVEADWDDQWGSDPSEFLGWVTGMFDDYRRLLHERGTFALFCSADMAAPMEMAIRGSFAVMNNIVWRKPGPGRLGRAEKEAMRRFFPTSERIIVAEMLRNPDGDLMRFRANVNHTVARDVYEDIRLRLVALRDAAGVTNRDVDRALGTNGMSGHYFGGSQWALPTAEAWVVLARLFEDGGVSDVPTYEELRAEFDGRRREFDGRRREFDGRRREFDGRRREFDGRPSASIELLSDVWTFDQVPATGRYANHPTQKPLALMQHIVGTLSRRGDTIVDCFMGTGTTLRAAKDLGRRSVGVEMNEEYCEAAAKRMAQETLLFDEPAPGPVDVVSQDPLL